MKILFYSAEPRSVMDEYVIRYLKQQRPHHTYMVISVNRPRPTITPWLRLKRRLVEFRDGPDHWLRSLEKLDKLLRRDLRTLGRAVSTDVLVERVNDDRSGEEIARFAPDVIVQCGAGILKPSIFSLARIATINLHHGIAPEVRGMRSTFWCLYYGLHHLIGVTCHKIDATLDTGEVILQEHHPYKPGQDHVSIQHQLCHRGAELLVRSIDLLQVDEVEVVRTEVDSYYFGELTSADFNALHQNNYRPVAQPRGLPRKRKLRSAMVFVPLQ